MLSVAHIINPFVADISSDLFVAQPITFQSILNAKEKAKAVAEVTLLTAQFEEDIDMVPHGFTPTQNLHQSVLDRAHFKTPVKLPLIYDILHRLYNESTSEYLIYTNVDIGLYPDFYLKVNDFINAGHDAFIINRRRIEPVYNNLQDLPLIYKERGKKHPGFDCFVFHRSLFPKFKLDGICIGVPFIEISFSQNLFAFAENFKLFEYEFLTFHLGMEIFKKRIADEYYQYNKKQFRKLMKELEPFCNQKKLPYANLNFFHRTIKRGLHPCIPIRYALKMEWKQMRGKD